MTPAEVLAAYRSSHVITLQQHGGEWRCAVDGLRVLPLRVPLGEPRRWRHDPSQIERLLEARYWGPFMSPTSEEARRDAFEDGRLTFEWHGHAVDVDLDTIDHYPGPSVEYVTRKQNADRRP